MIKHAQYNLPDTQTNNQVFDSNLQVQPFIVGPSIVRTDKDLTVKDFFTVNNIEIFGKIGRKLGIKNASGDYTALLTDFFITVSQVATSTVITLPKSSLAGIGKVYIIKDISGSALSTSISVVPFTGETINGDTSTSIATDYGKIGLFTDGSNWFDV